MSRKEELLQEMSSLRAKFYNIRHGFRTLKSYNYVGKWTKKQALDSINDDFKKIRDEYLSLSLNKEENS